jgi:hypothetical protein
MVGLRGSPACTSVGSVLKRRAAALGSVLGGAVGPSFPPPQPERRSRDVIKEREVNTVRLLHARE